MADSPSHKNADLPVNLHARKEYVAKGSNSLRCESCMLAQALCICDKRIEHSLRTEHPVHICLLMHKEEAYKPTNTGRLIEHVLPEVTHRYYWHRTEPDKDFLALLKNEMFQSYIIFPGDRGGYEERIVQQANWKNNKIPLFVILDGSWRQAGRMFRLSKYLQDLPVLPLSTTRHSQYKLRKAPDEFHLCTAEVAIELLLQHEQEAAGNALNTYFICFNEAYAASRRMK